MASTSPRAMVPQDITRIAWVSDPQIAADGGRVAFVVTTLSEERDEYGSSIWVVDADGGGAPRRFTAGPKRDRDPRWSPDGTRLAFVSEREGKTKGQLYVMPADGGEPTRLTDERHGVTDPVWSPDGRRLAFTARVGGWQEPEREEDKQKSKPARVITTLKYRWNGEGFTYDRRRHVFVVAAEGGPARQLTDGDWDDADPAWSPDGRAIAFSSARHPDRDRDDCGDIWLVAADGGEARRVTDTLGPAALPAFSPDGRTLAYLGRRSRNEAGRNVRVFTVATEGGTPRCLTLGLDRSCGPLGTPPHWAPDGGAITFAAEDQGALGLYRVPVAGGAPPVRVIDGERVVTGFSLSRRRWPRRLRRHRSRHARRGLRGGGRRRRASAPLTDMNRAWRGEVALARPERLRFERAGFSVDVWVMKPHGFERGGRVAGPAERPRRPSRPVRRRLLRRVPGVRGRGLRGDLREPAREPGLRRGIHPRRRRRLGRWRLRRRHGGARRRRSPATPGSTPRASACMGGSYGGFLTSWIVGHDHRFKAACSERAVNDQHGMFGNSDIGHLFNVIELGGVTPWENMAEYLARSPLTYAADVTTPLLILHSEDDLRCPIEQAEQLFVALKTLGKEVVFVRFPDENHELSRSGKPRHRLERFRFILDWFARHLGGRRAEG